MKATTEKGSPKFVPPEARIATFDQDGTTWVEQPMYSFVMYALDRVPDVVKAKPDLKNVQAFKVVLSGNRDAMAKLAEKTGPFNDSGRHLTGMPVDEFNTEVLKWLATAKDSRWKRPYTELTYQPMQEVLRYFRANGYKTYIVTGGGQDFVRLYSRKSTASRPSRLSAPPL